MRRLSAGVVLAALAMGAVVSSGAQQAPPETFRAAIDLIQLDVSVLDSDRMPVRGLTAADFTVLENGVARPVEAFAAVDLPDRIRTGAAWLRNVAPDVVSNRRDTQRVVLILLDDAMTPWDPGVLKFSRTIAQTVVDELGPADLAGVVYTSARRNGQELTTDRVRLMAAVERFVPIGPTPIPGRFSAARARGPMPGVSGPRGECPRQRCLTDALRNAAEILTGWPGARKTIVLVGASAPGFSGTMDDALLIDDLGRTFAAMQRANLNVYQFDPRGLEVDRRITEQFGIFAENTGGWAVTNTNAPWEAVPQVFRENSSYYLLGFRPADPRQDGRFRKVSVQVSRPGVEVRARAGYFPPLPEPEARPSDRPGPTPIERALAGGLPTSDLPLSLNVVPIPVSDRDEAAVVVIAGLDADDRVDARALDVVDVVVTAFTDTWREAASSRQRFEITTRGPEGMVADANVVSRLDLEPGRYEVRLAVQSTTTGRTGSVFASITVPDFSKVPLGFGGVLIARGSADDLVPAVRAAALPESPVVPWPASVTTARSFDRFDAMTATVPISQAGRRQAVPVQLTATIVDDEDRQVFGETVSMDAASFGLGRQTLYRFRLPLGQLAPGRYLLSFVAVAGTDEVQSALPFQVEGRP